MIAFTAAEIADITDGRLQADPGIVPESVTTDSRDVTPGALYVAKNGEHADGHAFLGQALVAGATLAIVEHDVDPIDGVTVPCVVVTDAVLAMGALAAEAVRRIRVHRGAAGLDFTVIGITGSAGKTTTKDLLAGILSATGSTVAPQGSYNGEVGVPLTIFRADNDTQFLVIEMGATGIGHIRYLGEMVQPDIGVVLCVGSAHAGEFGGVQNIAVAKGELVESLSTAGTAILNRDDQQVWAMASRTGARVLAFSAENSPAADGGPTGDQRLVQALSVDTAPDGTPRFDLVFPADSETYPVASQLIGRHHVTNLLAAAAAAFAVGIPAAEIASSLSSQGPASRWRMERTERADGVTIINDAYNANPESMRAALRTLADLGRGRRTWAVLGAMLELGEDSIREHTAVGTQVVRLNISRLLVVGRAARSLYVSAVQEGSWGDECIFAETMDEAQEILARELVAGDLVLFKSSNSVGLRLLGDRIAALLPIHTENDGSAQL